tara:strand:+ start:172 stop:504 length:333 start_codon:yes stop_codon:yes gene_type:complete
MNNILLVLIGFFIFFLIPYYVIFNKNLNKMIYYSYLWTSITATIPDVTVFNLLHEYNAGKRADKWKKQIYKTKKYSFFKLTGLFFLGCFIFVVIQTLYIYFRPVETLLIP